MMRFTPSQPQHHGPLAPEAAAQPLLGFSHDRLHHTAHMTPGVPHPPTQQAASFHHSSSISARIHHGRQRDPTVMNNGVAMDTPTPIPLDGRHVMDGARCPRPPLQHAVLNCPRPVRTCPASMTARTSCCSRTSAVSPSTNSQLNTPIPTPPARGVMHHIGASSHFLPGASVSSMSSTVTDRFFFLPPSALSGSGAGVEAAAAKHHEWLAHCDEEAARRTRYTSVSAQVWRC